MHKYFLVIICFVVLFSSCKKNIPLSAEKNITAFIFKAADNGFTSDVNGSFRNDTIYVKLPANANIHHLVPSISFTGKSLNPSDKSIQDFSGPVRYAVTAENGSTKTYTVIVSYRSFLKEITGFVFKATDNAGLGSDVNATISGDTITAVIPQNIDITRLVPTVIYSGVGLNPQSKSALNFSVPVKYTVTAEDSSTRDYIVQVNANKTVFIAVGNFVYALNAADGTVRWKYNLGYAASSVSYHNGVVFSGGYKDYLCAIDAYSGKLKWKTTSRLGVHTLCTFDNGTVFYGLNHSLSYRYLCAVDEETGTFKWGYQFPACGYCYLGNPVAADGIVYIPNAEGDLYAFEEETGNIKWRNNSMGLSGGNPVVANGSVYISSAGSLLTSFDAKTGNINWSVREGSGSSGSLVLKDGIFYNGGATSNITVLYAVDSATRSVQWMNNSTAASYFTSPAVDNNNVYANNKNGVLYAVNAANGDVVWLKSDPGQAVSAPLVANGTIYTCRTDKNLYAIDAGTGLVKWTFSSEPGLLTTVPVVIDANGTVFTTADFGEHD